MAAHADEWRALAVGAGNLFVTPEWAMSWFEVYGSHFEPSIRCLTYDGRLAAILPLMTGSDGNLRFVGDGVGDVFEPLVAADAPPDALGTLLGSLTSDRGKLLILTNVVRGAPWRDELGPQGAHAALADRHSVLPYLDLDGLDWPGFLASRSANFRSQLGRKKRALERSHEVTWRLSQTPADVDGDIDRLFDLHDRRWEGRGRSSISSPRMRTFLRLVCDRCLDQGWLRLWTLELDGTPAAAWLGWRVGSRYSYYLAGFDPARGHESPGFVLLGKTVEAAIGEGASVYDFLLGDESYKSRFATEAREVETEIIGPRWSRRLIAVRAERAARRIGRTLPTPARERLWAAGERIQRHLPWGRYR